MLVWPENSKPSHNRDIISYESSARYTHHRTGIFRSWRGHHLCESWLSGHGHWPSGTGKGRASACQNSASALGGLSVPKLGADILELGAGLILSACHGWKLAPACAAGTSSRELLCCCRQTAANELLIRYCDKNSLISRYDSQVPPHCKLSARCPDCL